MKIYYRGGRIDDHLRVKDDDTIMSRQLAPKQVQIGKFFFSLSPGLSLDGGLIFDCINEHTTHCENCEGHGEYECGYCNGTGMIECSECDATGSVQDDEKIEDKERLEKEAAATKAEIERKQISMGF